MFPPKTSSLQRQRLSVAKSRAGYPGVGPRIQVKDLRFSMGTEIGFEAVVKNLNDDFERIKQSPRFPGECKTKCFPMQNCEYCQTSSKLKKWNNPEARSQRIFYQNDTLPGNSCYEQGEQKHLCHGVQRDRNSC